MTTRISAVTVLLAISAAPVLAQNTQTLITSPVYVRSADGSERRGQLLRLGPDTLSLLDEGRVHDVPLADVTRIESRGDSVKNGAIIGAVILGAWCALICPQGLDGYGGGAFASVLAINTALGAAVGAGIDGMHVGRTTIYQPAEVASGRRPAGVKAFLSKRFRF
jgi:hypothetical protein